MFVNLLGYQLNIDEEDMWIIYKYKWCLQTNISDVNRYIYFATYINKKSLLLHRVIMRCVTGDKKIVDHINGNTLDCSKKNLRIVTHQNNMRNSRMRKTNRTGYKGVSLSTRCSTYRARIKINGKDKFLGGYKTPEEAYAAYCIASKKYHGEYGRIA